MASLLPGNLAKNITHPYCYTSRPSGVDIADNSNELLNLSGAKLAMRPFIKVRTTPDHGRDEKALFDTLGGTGYPTIMVKANIKTPAARLRTMKKVNEKWEVLTVSDFKKKLDQKIL